MQLRSNSRDLSFEWLRLDEVPLQLFQGFTCLPSGHKVAMLDQLELTWNFLDDCGK